MRIRRQAPDSSIHVQSHDCREKILINFLCIGIIPVRTALISERHVKIAISTEMQVTAIVITRSIVLDNETRFCGWVALVRVRGGQDESRQNIMPPGPG